MSFIFGLGFRFLKKSFSMISFPCFGQPLGHRCDCGSSSISYMVSWLVLVPPLETGSAFTMDGFGNETGAFLKQRFCLKLFKLQEGLYLTPDPHSAAWDHQRETYQWKSIWSCQKREERTQQLTKRQQRNKEENQQKLKVHQICMQGTGLVSKVELWNFKRLY